MLLIEYLLEVITEIKAGDPQKLNRAEVVPMAKTHWLFIGVMNNKGEPNA